jgi:lactoylglutathione lyase
MKIEHIAFWVQDLEVMKAFYQQYFNVGSSKKYVNETKNFSSYFLSFGDGVRLELMHNPGIAEQAANKDVSTGYAHMSISVGSNEAVDQLTDIIKSAGFVVSGEPRTTGDGYYESVVKDPEGNLIEITE